MLRCQWAPQSISLLRGPRPRGRAASPASTPVWGRAVPLAIPEWGLGEGAVHRALQSSPRSGIERSPGPQQQMGRKE